LFLCISDDPEGRAIFHRCPRISEFTLAQDFATGCLARPLEQDERGVDDEFEPAGEGRRGGDGRGAMLARARFATQMRLLRVKSVFLGDANPEAVEVIAK